MLFRSGEYKVKVKVTNPNYADRLGEGKVKITKKSVTLIVDNASKTYGEDDPIFKGTVDGLVNEGDLGTVTYVREGSDSAVGTYKEVLNANYEGNANYTVTVTKGDFEITKASNEEDLIVTGKEVVYDGLAHGIVINNLLDEETVEYRDRKSVV